MITAAQDCFTDPTNKIHTFHTVISYLGSVNTGRMNTRRYWYTATILANGLVLVGGGNISTTTVTSSAELYDPAAGN